MVNEIKRLQKEKQKAISEGKWKEAAAASNYLGAELFKSCQYNQALECHQEELNFCEMAGDRLGIAVANRKIGECYAELHRFKRALSHIKTFLDIAISVNSLVEEQRAWATFGRTYYMKYLFETEGDCLKNSTKTLDQAEQAYVRALELSEGLKSTLSAKEYAEMRARLLLNLGLVCEQRGDLSECAENIRHAIFLAAKYDLHEDLNRCQYSLASVYQKHKQYSYALRLLDGAIASAEKLHDIPLRCEALVTKASILISLKDFEGGKLCLKTAFKLHSPVQEDHDKTADDLKICVGLCMSQNKLLSTDDHHERRVLLEKIADALASLNCYKLAIEYYSSVLKCMEEIGSPKIEKAPIYFSLAQTYYDDGDFSKALEFLQVELDCNENKPSEQIKTLWKMADIFEEKQNFEKCEEKLVKAVSLAEEMKSEKFICHTLKKLMAYYESNMLDEKAEGIKTKLKNLALENLSNDEDSDVEEENQDPFANIHLSEISDIESETEVEMDIGSRSKRRPKKAITKVNEKGETPLHQACIGGNLSMVKRLVESGHPVNARDFCGWTPLHEACNHGYYDVVEYLLEKGAHINDRGGPLCGGITALHDAASCGNLDVMQLLISKGASVTMLDDNGETPLQALLNWKKRSRNDLDAITLKQCKCVEDQLKEKMTQAGQSVKEIDHDSLPSLEENLSLIDDVGIPIIQTDRKVEKRVRSPSVSSDSCEEEIDHPKPYFSIDKKDWDNANQVQSEYQAVMASLRRSAKNVATPANSVPKPTKTSLIDETESVQDWLIKDTNYVPKVKRKRRKMSRLNVRTSKSICNYLTPNDKPADNDGTSLLLNDTESFVTEDDSSNSSNSFQESEKNVSHLSKRDNSKLSFCLRVRIADKLILVPVPEENCSVGWLAEQAAIRYQNLVGSRPHLTLMTKDGALLSNSDLLSSIFDNNDEVISSVEFWDEPSLLERYVQMCNKRGVKVLPSVEKRFQNFETCPEVNFSNCSIIPLQISLIFLSLSHYKTLQHLDLSGTVITDASMNEMVSCFPSLFSLVSLNLSCCCLTSQSLKCIAEYLFKKSDPQDKLPNLKSLNLSYNVFSPGCESYLEVILKLPSLISIDLSFCGLNSSCFSNSKFCQALQTCHEFEEFNLSGNILDHCGLAEFFRYLPRTKLTKLDLSYIASENIDIGIMIQNFMFEKMLFLKELVLQGCHLKDLDLHNISSKLSNSPHLKSCNLSANPELSGDSICSFLRTACVNGIVLTYFNVTGTCVWKKEYISPLTDIFKLKVLKHLCLDNIPDYLFEELILSWKNCWGNRAKYFSCSFSELSII